MDVASIRSAVESALAVSTAAAALNAAVEVRDPTDWRNQDKFGVEVRAPNGIGGSYFVHSFTIGPQDKVVTSSVPWVTEELRLGGIEGLLIDVQERAARTLMLDEIKVPARSAHNAPLELYPKLYMNKGYSPTTIGEVLIHKVEPCLSKVLNA